MATVTYAKALNAALRHSLDADPNVLIFGEDVGVAGGVFRITDGITHDYGEDRCFDTPLAESGIVGFGIGLCKTGFRPVVEMQFDAFAYPALEQIFSHVAKLTNRTNGGVRLPMVLRVPFAGGIGGVEHHCDSSEAYYAHTAGLKVVTPASVRDAYFLLRASIDDDDPVVFMETKRLYWSKEELDLDALRSEYDAARTQHSASAVEHVLAASAPAEAGPSITAAHDDALLGHARVLREGTDVTLVGYGPSISVCLDAAEAAAEEGWSVEVVDLRSIVPLDDTTPVASVRKTGRCVVVQEAQGFCGVGAEIASRLQERAFHSLHAPVLRVSGLDIPYPWPMVEHTHLPSVDRVLDTIARLQWDDQVDTQHLTQGGTR